MPGAPGGSTAAAVAVVMSALATAGVLVAGPGASAGPVVGALVIAYLLFGFAVTVARPSRRLVLSVGAALLALAVVRPPTGSHDLWSYVMYGRIVAQHHANPYVMAPKHFPRDPFLAHVDHLWVATRSVYGPLFTGWSALLARLSGDSTLAARLGFQATAAAAVVAAIILLDRRSRGDGRILALVALNPLVICNLVNDAHVDALVGLAVLVAVLFVESSRPKAAGAALGLGVLVKATALLPLGALGLWLLMRRPLRPAAHFAAAMLFVVVAGYAVGGGVSAIRPLASSTSHMTRASVWPAPEAKLVDARIEDGMTARAATKSVSRELGLVAAVTVVAGAALLVLVNGRRASPALAAGGAVLAYMLLGSYVFPWYAGAGIFVLALLPRWPPAWIFLAHGALLQLSEVPGQRFVHPLIRGTASHSLQALFQRSILPAMEVMLVVAVALMARRGLERDRLSV